jgi:hypothetical protein
MNPRRIHDLMRTNFPPFDAAKVEWTNVVERDGPNVQLLQRELERHICAAEVLIEIHRKSGALVPRHEAAQFIAGRMGQGDIRIADRQFTSFVVVAQNGVVGRVQPK